MALESYLEDRKLLDWSFPEVIQFSPQNTNKRDRKTSIRIGEIDISTVPTSAIRHATQNDRLSLKEGLMRSRFLNPAKEASSKCPWPKRAAPGISCHTTTHVCYQMAAL